MKEAKKRGQFIRWLECRGDGVVFTRHYPVLHAGKVNPPQKSFSSVPNRVATSCWELGVRGHLADNSADLAIFAAKPLYLAMHELLDVVFNDRTAGSQLIWGSDAPRNIVPC